jgi:hypothetical protein
MQILYWFFITTMVIAIATIPLLMISDFIFGDN